MQYPADWILEQRKQSAVCQPANVNNELYTVTVKITHLWQDGGSRQWQSDREL